MYEYRARLISAVDGDTFDLDIDLGFKVHLIARCRLRSYSAPELREPLGLLTTSWLISEFANATMVIVKSYKDRMSFERWLIDVYLDGVDLAHTLQAKLDNEIGVIQ